MSEEFIVDPDVPAEPPPPVVAAAEPSAEPEPEPPAEDDIPEAVEVQPGVRVVPVGVVQAQRQEIKALKEQAKNAAELQRQLDQFRPYVDFVQQNQQILQQPVPPAPVQQSEDPALIEYARTLDLYTQDGRPDTARAAKLRDMTRQEASAIAQQAIAPMQEASYEHQAATQIQALVNSGIAPEHIAEAVRNVLPAQMPAHEARAVMANPAVMNLIRLAAQGIQAAAKAGQPAPPAPPAAPALFRESPGGPMQVQVSEDHTRKLGVKHAEYLDAAKRYQPNRSNSLE